MAIVLLRHPDRFTSVLNGLRSIQIESCCREPSRERTVLITYRSKRFLITYRSNRLCAALIDEGS